jgi:predicted Fe-Mo cluster-binding NifX family protein
MKIAICSAGPDPASSVHPHFSSAPWFLIHDVEAGSWQAVGNTGGHVDGQCAGGRLALALGRAGVGALITGQCGAGALNSLRSAGIVVYSADSQPAVEAAERLRQGLLPVMAGACSHHGHQHGGSCGHHS